MDVIDRPDVATIADHGSNGSNGARPLELESLSLVAAVERKRHVAPLAPFGGLPTVSVVVPALNEAPNLAYVLPLIPDWVSEVILVDGGSTDDTVAVAQALVPDIRIVTQPG